MGRDSGSGLGLAILAGILLFAMKDRKLTSTSFTDPSRAGFDYRSYQTWALAPDEDVEGDPDSQISTTYTGRRIRTITVGGVQKIPLPGGGTAPMPTPHVGRVDVGSKLRPVTPTTKFKYMEYEEDEPPEQFQDVGGRKSVNLRLKPL